MSQMGNSSQFTKSTSVFFYWASDFFWDLWTSLEP